MATHSITLESAGGEYMEAVLVLEWTVQPGSRVRAGDHLVTVETAKAATEVEAERDGWLTEIFYAAGQEAPVGAVLGTISDSEPKPGAAIRSAEVRAAESSGAAIPSAPLRADGWDLPREGRRVIASPLARRLAMQAGLNLSGVVGTGLGGRVKRRDVEAALGRTTSAPTASVAEPPGAGAAAAAAHRQAAADPVVLLHGFGADRSTWRQVTPLLPFTTVALDLPGHGDEPMPAQATIDEMAFALSDRLEALGIGRAHLVGHSLGGALALALASLGRLSVRSLTLLVPAGLGPEINAGLLKGLAEAHTPEALEPWLRTMVANPAVLPSGYAKAVMRQYEKTGARHILPALAAALFPSGTQGFDLSSVLNAVDVPLRVLWGRTDGVIPPSHAAQVPGAAAVHLLSGIGHVPQMECPALTARLIAETVRSAG